LIKQNTYQNRTDNLGLVRSLKAWCGSVEPVKLCRFPMRGNFICLRRSFTLNPTFRFYAIHLNKKEKEKEKEKQEGMRKAHKKLWPPWL
jgi:hypothetical protein